MFARPGSSSTCSPASPCLRDCRTRPSRRSALPAWWSWSSSPATTRPSPPCSSRSTCRCPRARPRPSDEDRLAAAARDLARLHQLYTRVVGRAEEGDAAAVGELDRSLQELGAQLLQPPDVRLDVRGVKAEVLEAEVRGGVPGLERLARARAGDVHGHPAVHALAADEAVAEHARLVVDDLEVERSHVPLGGAAGIR